MNTKEKIFWGINNYIIKNKMNLTEFQEWLDYEEIESSLCTGEDEKELYIEVFKDSKEEEFYLKISPKGEILESYN